MSPMRSPGSLPEELASFAIVISLAIFRASNFVFIHNISPPFIGGL